MWNFVFVLTHLSIFLWFAFCQQPEKKINLDHLVDLKTYEACVTNHSSLDIVRTFSKKVFDNVPEPVLCAFRCMAQACFLLSDTGYIFQKYLKVFPAFRNDYNRTKQMRLTYENLETCLDIPGYVIKNCREFADAMFCFQKFNLLG